MTLFVLLLLMAGLAACGDETQSSLGESAVPAQEETPLPVTVSQASHQDMVKTLTLGNLLRPQEETTLLGGGAGSKILKINVEVGDRVSKGQVILTQDMRDLAVQEETLLLNRGQLQDSYDKNMALYEAGALPESQITGLENQLKQVDLQLEALRLSREKMTVSATIDGIISALPVVEGQMAAASTPVAAIVNIDKLLLDVQVGESYINGVTKGEEMEVWVPSLGGDPVIGRVKTVPPTINPQTRAYAVTVEVDNPDLAIKGGMYGEIKLVVEKAEQALVVPQFAILQLDEGAVVFVEEDGVARKRVVEVGLALGDNAQILSGLAAGEKVIVEGQYSVSDGRKLNVLDRGEGQ